MAEGARAIITEILAEKIFSLARRGEDNTVLEAGDAGNVAHDRLVVFLRPSLKDTEGGEKENSGEIRDEKREVGPDERARHALIVPCAPGQVKQSVVRQLE